MAEDQGVQLMRRKLMLQGLRTLHEDTWRDCLNFSFPIRAGGFNGETNDTGAAKKKRADLLDSTSTESCRTLASSIPSGMTPANSRWFGLGVGNETDEEKRWLDQTSETLWENIHATNFDAASFECCLDIVSAGWFVLYIDEDRERGGFAFEQWPIDSCYLASSKPGGAIDTIFRDYDLTVEQCVSEFGMEGVSEKVGSLYEDGKLDEKVKLLHAIYPRPMYAIGSKRAKNLPFASCHVECDSKQIVRESGYHEFPCAVPRWVMIPKSVYAVGPMFDALPDVKQLNRLVYLEDTNADIAIAGMWIAEDDGVLNPRTVTIGPRKIIVANSVDSMKPLVSGANFDLSFTKKHELQGQIRKILMADQLQPKDGPAMTATEVHERVRLIRQLLGPVYGRLQAEYLQPLIARCFGLASRAGVFTAAPESLRNRAYHVTYISPMAKSQKLEEVSAIQQTLLTAGEMQKVVPDIMDNFDTDEAIRMVSDGNGAPSKMLRPVKDRDQLRSQRAKATQEAQQQQQQASLTEKVAPHLVKQAA